MKKILTNNGKILTDNGKILVANVESIAGGANIVSKGGTAVPNNTYVEKIYFNTSLSVDEVVSLLSQLTYNSQGMNYLALPSDGSIALTAMTMNGVYILVDYISLQSQTPTIYFASQDVGFGIVGWNTNFNGVLEINQEVIPTDVENGEPKIGLENDKLIDLMSLTNSFGSGGGVIKTLEGDYQAVDIVVNELPSGPTPLENNLNVEKIYFNTNLTNEEVDAILDTLTLNSDLQYVIRYQEVEGTTTYHSPLIIVKAEAYVSSASGYAILDSTDALLYASNETVSNFVSSYLGISAKVGWNVSELEATNGTILDVGVDGDKLTQLFSATPFVEPNTIDLEQYLDNKQMPMSVKVNIGSTNIVSQDGEIIKTLKGDYEAVDLEFNELPSFWQETVFVNGNYVEKLYFNTELTTDEIDAIFSTLTYDDNSHLITQYATAEAGRFGSIYIIKMETNGLNGYTIRISNFDGDSYIYASNQEIANYIKSNYNKSVEVGLNITEFPINNTIHTVSNEISNLTNLISSKPPLKNTINVESYLDNKQMPLSVTVNVASSGGGGIIEVEELPTTNIDSNAFYKTPRKFTNVYYKITKYNTGTFLTLSGIKINGTEVVETKPTTNIIQSNLATYECYLYYVKTENDIFVYLNAGAGLQWYNLAAIFALLQVGNLTFIGETDGTRSQVETELGYYAYFEDEKYYKEKENNLTEYADRNSILSRFFSGLQLEPLDLFVNISSMPLNYFKNVNTEYFKITFTVSGTTNFTDYYNSLGQNGFRGCSAKTIYLTNLEPSVQLSIGYDVFIDCKNLTSLVLDFASILRDIETTEFSNTPIANGNGYIYVRDELVDTVKAMTNWSAYASQIKPLSEYVEE